MLRHSIENFKAYKNKNSIELKPITLVFGANNAGKSSLLKSLVYAATFYEHSDLDMNDVQIGEEDIHFGGIGNLVNTNGDGVISISQEYNLLLPKDDLNGDEIGYLFEDEFTHFAGRFSYQIEVDVKNYDVPLITLFDVKIENIKLVTENFIKQKIKKLDQSAHLRLSSSSTNLPYLEIEYIDEFSCELFSGLAHWDVISITPYEEVSEVDFYNSLKELFKASKVVLDTGFRLIINHEITDDESKIMVYHGEGDEDIQSTNIEYIAENFFEHFTNTKPPSFNYIGPLRKAPSRFLLKSYGREGWFDRFFKQHWKRIKKEEYFNRQLAHFNTLLTDDRYLGLDYKLVIETYRSEMNTSRVLETLSFQNIKTGEIVSLQDLGMGFSQFLPILSELEFGRESLIIEQPELHLHPGFQSRIGAILSKWPKKNSFMSRIDDQFKDRFLVIETHSEHIIKSLQLEVARFHQSGGEEGISHDDISILYVSKDEEGAQIREIGLDQVGSFTEPWPDDFFERSADLTYDRLKMINKN